jgi:hypothetical protein
LETVLTIFPGYREIAKNKKYMGTTTNNFAEVEAIFAENKKKNDKALSDSINAFNKNNTDSNRYNVTRVLHNQMQYIRNGALALFMIVALALTSCNKQPYEAPQTPPDTREMVTQDLKLTNIYTAPFSKGFDATTWVYNYNAGSYVLTFTNVNNPLETVTKTVTVAQLKLGVSVSIFAGKYNITYQTTHLNTTTVDININMLNTDITGTPIALSATYDDFLVVVDINTGGDVPAIATDAGTIIEPFTLLNGFYYIYYDKKSDVSYGGYKVRFSPNGGAYKLYDMLAFTFGNIYWYVTPIGAGTTITFPQWVVNKITVI